MAPVDILFTEHHSHAKNKSRPQKKNQESDLEDEDQNDSSGSSRSSESESDDEIETFWIGPGVLGHPLYQHTSKSKSVKLYQAVKLVRDEKFSYVVGVGDFVHLRSSSDNPYIGRVMDLFEDSKGEKFATVQWLYMPNDIKVLAGQNLKYEVVYAAEHLDKIEVETILEPVRIQFEIKCSDGHEKIVKSRLYSDAKDSDNFCLYKCRFFYDLGTQVTPLTEEKFKEIENVPFNEKKRNVVAPRDGNDETVDLLTSEDEINSRPSRKSSARGSSRSSEGSEEESEEEIYSDDEKGKRKRRRPSHSKKPTRSSFGATTTTLTTRQSNAPQATRSGRTSPAEIGRPKPRKASNRAARVVDDENLVHRHREMTTNSTTKVSDAIASMRSSLITDLDEKLWGLFQDIRNEFGSDEAMEILGYLKLEYLTENDARSPADKIYPPYYISGLMEKPSSQSSISKVRKLLGLQNINKKNVDKLTPKEVAAGIRQAFKELEQCRPGVVFDQLATNEADVSFEFPRKVSLPLFGALLGLDGFRTCEMIYHRQLIRVPIEREGSVAQAAFRAFSNLVMPSFSFVLVRTGDFTFEVAPSPEEKCDQIFVKLPSNRSVSLHVPAKKALLRFIKVLIAESEGISMDKQSFLFYGKHFGEEPQDDTTPLAQFHIKFASTLILLAK